MFASGSAQADPAIGDFAGFEQVSSQRVSRVVTEFTYRAVATNDTPAVTNVTAAVTSTSPNTTIVDGDLSFGGIAEGGSAVSTDTFSFRHDRRFPFESAVLQYAFQFDVVATNTPPVADAGLNQTVLVGETVALDASGSSDADGDALSFSWSLTTVPPGSLAALSNASAADPTFIADVPGTYVAELVVNDGSIDSAPDTVTISTGNSPPVANAGPDQTVLVGETVTLNGSGSSDVDGDALTFSWTLTTAPAGSAATLSDPTAVNPTFVADAPGSYAAELVVDDGTVNSAPDTVTISTGNSPPVANAGPDQTVLVGQAVTLDGSASSDVDGDALTFSWSLTVPTGSSATLSDPAAASPTFTPDVAGTYVATLVVGDGTVSSAPDTATISTDNSVPVADAGPDQTVFVGDTVSLNGGGSSDVDGDPLTFAWSFVSRPADSTTTLDDPTLVMPTFFADAFGTYVLQLIVNDGTADSVADTVTIITENTPPVADAGPAQTALVGATVTLDGSGSSDVDGDALTFAWSLTSRPSGSVAALNDPAAVMPTFVIDQPGTYIAQLIVNDGTVDSAPDTVTISTGNSPPAADAGADQTAFVGDTVTLDGSGSSDGDNDPLTFSWSLTSVPQGSGAALSNANAVNPSFTIDVAGEYVAQLIVNDGVLDSAPDTVAVTTINSPPVARAGADQTAIVGDTVTLDGSASSDADNDPLTFFWSIISAPGGSAATLSDAAAVSPTFVPDLAGTYLAQLIVNDGTADSAPDSSLVEVSVAPASLITLSPDPAQMVTRDTLAMTATLDNPAGSGGQVINLNLSNAIATVPPNVTVPEGDLGVTFDVTSAIATGSFNVIASDTDLTGDTATVSIIRRDFTLSSPLVGIDRTVPASITLAQPAPAGGASIAMSVADTGVATVSPATVIIPQGRRVGAFELTGGLTPGFTTVSADGTADGYTSESIDITVTDRLIDVPSAEALALGETRTIQVLIAPDPAPAGGVEIALESSDPSLVEVLTPTVTVPAGDFTAEAQIRAVTDATGTATITASNPGFAPDTTSASVTTQLNVLESFAQFEQADSESVFIQLTSSGQPFEAPAGGVDVTLTSADPACVTVASPVTVAAGDSLATAALSFGGTADPLPCTTTVTATNALFGTDTVEVTVMPVAQFGAIAFDNTFSFGVGGGLQVAGRARLPARDHGGVTVQIEVSDRSLAYVAPDADTAGLPVVEVFVPDGQIIANFVLQGVSGATGPVTVTASSPLFTDGTTGVEIRQPALAFNRFSGANNLLNTSTTTLSPDDPFAVATGVPSGTSLFTQGVSAAAAPLTVTLTSSDPAVGALTTLSQASASPVTVQIAANNARSPSPVSNGGVAFDPLGGGTTTVSATAPGFNAAFAQASVDVTVSQPAITFDNTFSSGVGGGLQVAGRARLGGSDHGGVTVRITSGNTSLARVAPDATTAGTAFIDVFVPDGQIIANFVLQGVSGATGTVTVTASSPLFTDGTRDVQIVRPVLDINALTTSKTTGSADDPFVVRTGVTTTGTNLVGQFVSAATTGVQVLLTSSDAAVGQLVTNVTTGNEAVVEIAPSESRSPTNVTAGGVAFDALAEGATTVSATNADFDNTFPRASVEVTVTP